MWCCSVLRNGFCSHKNLRCGFLAGSTYRSWVVILHHPILYSWVLRMDDRDELRRLIDVIEKGSGTGSLEQAIDDIKTFANTASFLANKLDTRLKGSDVKAKNKPKSRMGKSIASVPKPNAPTTQKSPPEPSSTNTSGMPTATSTSTSQADFERLKPQGSQPPVGAS
jgi:hypothetical protein